MWLRMFYVATEVLFGYGGSICVSKFNVTMEVLCGFYQEVLRGYERSKCLRKFYVATELLYG